MSTIRITESFHQRWKQAVVQAVEEQNREYTSGPFRFPPRPSQSEPYPEEFEDVLEAVRPFLVRNGNLNSTQVAYGLLTAAGSLGISGPSLYPLYYLAGISEISPSAGIIPEPINGEDSSSWGEDEVRPRSMPAVQVGDNSELAITLSHLDSCTLPLVYLEPFPLSVRIARSESPSQTELGGIMFPLFNQLMMRPFSFFNADEVRGENVHIAPTEASRGSDGGVGLRFIRSGLRYGGCFRLLNTEEINWLFSTIRPNCHLSFPNNFSYRDFFCGLGMTGREIDSLIQQVRDPEPAIPRPSMATNVQEVAREPEEPERRNGIRGAVLRSGPANVGRPRANNRPSRPAIVTGRTVSISELIGAQNAAEVATPPPTPVPPSIFSQAAQAYMNDPTNRFYFTPGDNAPIVQGAPASPAEPTQPVQ